MPVLVVGADTPVGDAIARRLAARASEVRAFVTDASAADPLRILGIKVATGDVSDASHIEGAARGAFVAVLVLDAAGDGRETAFAAPRDVPGHWARAVAAAGVHRVIVVGDDPPGRPDAAPEWAVVPVAGGDPEAIAATVAVLDEAERL